MCFRVYRVYIAVGLLEFYSGTQYVNEVYSRKQCVTAGGNRYSAVAYSKIERRSCIST